jgi:microcystin degradation protein MlrC
VLVVEPSDNIGAGAPGENTHLLGTFIKEGLQGAGVIINDPQAVRELHETPPGASARVSIGGKSGEIGAEPLTLKVRVIRHSDGSFMLEDRHSHLAAGHGQCIDMGPCTLVRHGGVLVLLTSRRTPPFDLGQWRSQGVDPEELSVIGIKAAAGHRQAYDPIAAASYTVDLPGPCAENLERLPYRRIRRPVFPLDADVEKYVREWDK